MIRTKVASVAFMDHRLLVAKKINSEKDIKFYVH